MATTQKHNADAARLSGRHCTGSGRTAIFQTGAKRGLGIPVLPLLAQSSRLLRTVSGPPSEHRLVAPAFENDNWNTVASFLEP